MTFRGSLPGHCPPMRLIARRSKCSPFQLLRIPGHSTTRPQNLHPARSRTFSTDTLYSTLEPNHHYRFHVATSWAGKPDSVADRGMIKVPFPKESVIGRWRDHMLSRDISGRGNKMRLAKDAGEDFFFVQEVRRFPVRTRCGR